MVNRDIGKKESVERRNPRERLTARDLPLERVLVVHSTDDDDAPNRQAQEAYTDENIDRLRENASPAAEGEEFRHEAEGTRKGGNADTPDSAAG